MYARYKNRLTLEDRVRFILQGEYAAAAVEPPALDLKTYQKISREMRRKARRPKLFPDPQHFVRKLGYVAQVANVDGCYGEVNDGSTIWYSLRGGPRVVGMRIYHGLSHCELLSQFGSTVTEADFWMQTFALALPEWYLLGHGPGLVTGEQEHFPEWAICAYYDALLLLRVADVVDARARVTTAL